MLRAALVVVAGVIVWFTLATVLNFGLRAWWPGYTAAEPIFAFTPGMQWARLLIGVVCSLAAGALAVTLAPRSRTVAWVLGVVLLALFIPDHIHVRSEFPLWYHAFFLLTLVPWVLLGAVVARTRTRGLADAVRAGD